MILPHLSTIMKAQDLYNIDHCIIKNNNIHSNRFLSSVTMTIITNPIEFHKYKLYNLIKINVSIRIMGSSTCVWSSLEPKYTFYTCIEDNVAQLKTQDQSTCDATRSCDNNNYKKNVYLYLLTRADNKFICLRDTTCAKLMLYAFDVVCVCA